jgi:replication initiation protein RepC
MEKLGTTPFGGARLTARNFALRADLDKRQSRLQQREPHPAGHNQAGRDQAGHDQAGPAQKWQIIRALSEARARWGLSDRAIAVLEALASFHADRHLDGRAPIIVFPSNKELSLRARGMSPATLRRHLASLVEAGLILRRDSANGKRYCRRDDQGQVENAFGFDLAPLALRSDDIFAQAESVRLEARAISRLRAEISLHLRDIAKTIAAGLERAAQETTFADAGWPGFAERLCTLSGRVARNGTPEGLSLRRDRLVRLRAEVEASFLDALTEKEMSANDHQIERHIQNTKPEFLFDKNGKRQEEGSGGTQRPGERTTEQPMKQTAEAVTQTQPGEGGREREGRYEPHPGAVLERKSAGSHGDIRLDEVLSVCPDIADYARGGRISSWHDMIGAAETVRSMLGISPSAWAEARQAMGPLVAATTLAAMLQRSAVIRSPGGYLRDLTARAQDARFSVRPMLRALRDGAS